nr:hypothetical protein [Hepelivirales sp.]
MAAYRNQNVDCIILKDRINNICQTNKLQFPIHSHYFSFNQRICTLSIGRMLFVGHNNFADDRTRTTRFLTDVIEFLSNKDKLELYSVDLSSSSFNTALPNADSDSALTVYSYSDLIKLSI